MRSVFAPLLTLSASLCAFACSDASSPDQQLWNHPGWDGAVFASSDADTVDASSGDGFVADAGNADDASTANAPTDAEVPSLDGEVAFRVAPPRRSA